MVWEDRRHDGRAHVFGTRVDLLTGAPAAVGGFAVSTSSNTELAPRASFDGAQYLVVWQDNRCRGPRGLEHSGGAGRARRSNTY